MIMKRSQILPTRAGRCARNKTQLGFTLVELLVVLAVLAMLGIAFVPAIAASRPNTYAWQCLNNHRQLGNAWRMYADDNSGALVYAAQDRPGYDYDYAWWLLVLDFNPG